MKLVQATCECGYQTRKARSGYHFHQWWFPVFSSAKSQLSDIQLTLPEEDRERIDHFSHQAYMNLPDRSAESKRVMHEECKAFTQSVHDAFVNAMLEEVQESQVDAEESVFDPPPGEVFTCPGCKKRSLVLGQVEVLAYCQKECGHEYRWDDSEVKGCPQCNYRPHRFKIMSHQTEKSGVPTLGACECSSMTESESYVDGFCPKCGALPYAYSTGPRHFCGMHHERMLPYRVPSNLFFVEPSARWVERLFPNAKFWGDAAPEEDSFSGRFCPSCEAHHQRWLQENKEDDT